jgi:hypothetical protein
MRHTDPHTNENAQNAKSRKKRRVAPHIFSNDRLDELLWRLLDDDDSSLRAYVYRLQDGQKEKPALFIGTPYYDLVDWLRDMHGGGEFHIIIRRGKPMELSGILCISAPVRR